jgi:hypothetical protein
MAHGPRTRTCAECGREYRHGRYGAYCSARCEREAGVKTVARRAAARAVVGLALGLELREVRLDRVAGEGYVQFADSLPSDEAEHAEAVAAIAASLVEEAVAMHEPVRRQPAVGVEHQLATRLLGENRTLVDEAAEVLLGAEEMEDLAQEVADLIRVRGQRSG